MDQDGSRRTMPNQRLTLAAWSTMQHYSTTGTDTEAHTTKNATQRDRHRCPPKLRSIRRFSTGVAFQISSPYFERHQRDWQSARRQQDLKNKGKTRRQVQFPPKSYQPAAAPNVEISRSLRLVNLCATH